MDTVRAGLSFGIVIIIAFIGYYWLYQPVVRDAVHIMAPRGDENQVPVFAQYIIRQSIHLDQTFVRASSMIVPMYVPDRNTYIIVRLYRNGLKVKDWHTAFQESGNIEYIIPFDRTILLDGDIIVEFDGSHIRNGDEDKTPRIYIEKADDAYPFGNYQVAQNQKEGDVALTLRETVSQAHVFNERFAVSPLGSIAKILLLMAVMILIARIPWLYQL